MPPLEAVLATLTEQNGEAAKTLQANSAGQALRQQQTSGSAPLLNILKSLPTKRRTIVQAIVILLWAVNVLTFIAGRPGNTIG